MAYYVHRFIVKQSEDTWDLFTHGIAQKLQGKPRRPQDNDDVETTAIYNTWSEKFSSCPVDIQQDSSMLDFNENTKRITYQFDTIEDARTYLAWRTTFADNPGIYAYSHEIRDEEGNLVSPN